MKTSVNTNLALKRKHLWHLLPVVCVWQSRNSDAIPSIAILAHEQNLLIAVLHFRLRLVFMNHRGGIGFFSVFYAKNIDKRLQWCYHRKHQATQGG
ncbi:MAG: hypothetical protein RSE58_02385 [Clostridia bacterium]